MGKVWVLDTATKGTGASMVPLESTLAKPGAPPPHRYATPPKRARRMPRPPEPKQPARFKVVDVVSGEVLADGASTRDTLETLRGIRSSVDVRVYAWRHKAGSWRLLGMDEQRALWRLRERAAAS